jgi:hypothetical protein
MARWRGRGRMGSNNPSRVFVPPMSPAKIMELGNRVIE